MQVTSEQKSVPDFGRADFRRNPRRSKPLLLEHYNQGIQRAINAPDATSISITAADINCNRRE